MTDLFKVLSGSFLTLVYAWVIPSMLAVSAFSLFQFPAIASAPGATDLASLATSTQLLVVVGAGFTMAILMALNATHLYRVLEGISWPKYFRDTRKAHWQEKWAIERERVKDGDASYEADPDGFVEARNWLKFYPKSADSIMATRLGNALKALELYGKEWYCLDALTMWEELWGVAPEPVRKDVDSSRGAMDFFVSSSYCSGAIGVLGLGVGLSRWDLAAALSGLVGVIVAPISYRFAVDATSWYRKSVQALVNLSRRPLAEALGLEFPDNIDDERKMWNNLTGFVYWGPDRPVYAEGISGFYLGADVPQSDPTASATPKSGLIADLRAVLQELRADRADTQ